MRRHELTPLEMEFFAEDELIEIVPNFKLEKLELLSGSFGPFEPLTVAQVPLWAALSLKQKNKCKIVTPSWMTLPALNELLNKELKDPNTLEPIPFHFLEIALILLDKASNDIESAQETRRLVENVWSKRVDKVQATAPKPNAIAFKFDKNLSGMEINKLRGFFSESLHNYDKILRKDE